MIRTFSCDHLINAEGSSTRKSVKVHACPGYWSKSFYSVGLFLRTSCFYFERCFFWSSRFFCNFGEMKWSFGMKNIRRQHVRISTCSHLQSVLFQFGRDVSVFYWTNAWCSVKLERKRMPYAYTIDIETLYLWHTHKSDIPTSTHNNLKVASTSLRSWNRTVCTWSCQRSEGDISMAMRSLLVYKSGRSIKTQVWTLYQNTHVNLVLQSIFARERNYRHTPSNHKIIMLLSTW